MEFCFQNQNRNDNYFREVSFGSVNRVACQCICSIWLTVTPFWPWWCYSLCVLQVLEYTVRDYIKPWYRPLSDHDAFLVDIWQCFQRVVITFASRCAHLHGVRVPASGIWKSNKKGSRNGAVCNRKAVFVDLRWDTAFYLSVLAILGVRHAWLTFHYPSPHVILEVQKLWKHQICKHHCRQMTHLEQLLCQTSDSCLVWMTDCVNAAVWPSMS